MAVTGDCHGGSMHSSAVEMLSRSVRDGKGLVLWAGVTPELVPKAFYPSLSCSFVLDAGVSGNAVRDITTLSFSGESKRARS